MPRAWRPKGSRASKRSRFDGAEPGAARARTTAILEKAARDVYDYLVGQLRTGKFYNIYWSDRQWGLPALSPEVIKGGAQLTFHQENRCFLDLASTEGVVNRQVEGSQGCRFAEPQL